MNRLSDATSPYLLQHAGNPVNWWPWSDEAFAEARARDGQAPVADLAALCDQAVTTLAADYDEQRGGFGGAPKFPPSMVLEFLLRNSERPATGQGSGGAGAASTPAGGTLASNEDAGPAAGEAAGP